MTEGIDIKTARHLDAKVVRSGQKHIFGLIKNA
jgi:hypothetical protein